MLCYTSENRSGYKRAGLSTNNQIFTLGSVFHRIASASLHLTRLCRADWWADIHKSRNGGTSAFSWVCSCLESSALKFGPPSTFWFIGCNHRHSYCDSQIPGWLSSFGLTMNPNSLLMQWPQGLGFCPRSANLYAYRALPFLSSTLIYFLTAFTYVIPIGEAEKISLRMNVLLIYLGVGMIQAITNQQVGLKYVTLILSSRTPNLLVLFPVWSLSWSSGIYLCRGLLDTSSPDFTSLSDTHSREGQSPWWCLKHGVTLWVACY